MPTGIRVSDRRAIELYEQTLTISREFGDRDGEGIALEQHGLAYFALGESREPLSSMNRLTIAREIGDRRLKRR